MSDLAPFPAAAPPDVETDVPWPTRLVDICLTAAEAYPAFEDAVLNAERCVHGSFRIFDPNTKLHGEAARAVGETWSDLLAHVLNRGINVSLVLSDFDAIARPELHRLAHCSARELEAISVRLAPGAGTFRVRLAAHPARMGVLPRIVMWPLLRRELGRHADELNDMKPAERDAALADQPGLARYLRSDEDGKVQPRRFVLPQVFPATHHQKLAVIDDRRLYIGGLDLNNRRFDDPQHQRPADETWHDVQLVLEGAAATEAAAHLARFTDESEGRQQPTPGRELKRTLSAARNLPLSCMGPRNVIDEIAEAHHRRIGESEDLIYIETQFFRDLETAKALAERGRAAPGLNLVMLLPAAPEEVAFRGHRDAAMRHGEALQLRCLETVQEAFGARVFFGSPAQTRRAPEDMGRATLRGAPIIYLHAKLATFDDRTAIVSSANLNGRSLSWDTEAGVVLSAPDDVMRLRARCMRHWIGPVFDATPERFMTAEGWAAMATQNAGLPPEDRNGFVMPFPWNDTDRFAEWLPVVPDEAV